jgi:signal transduction histidine kinase
VAQDVAPAPRGVVATRPFERFAALLKRANLLPPGATPGRVTMTRPLVTYVTFVTALSVVVAALTVRGVVDWTTLAVGSVATFLMAVYAVRSLPGSSFVWSPSVFVNLGLSVTLGPTGAAAAAISEALGVAARTRNGWFRTVFNVSNHLLSNVSAWGAYSSVVSLAGPHPQSWEFPLVELAAGLAAGVTQFLVNHTLMTAVIRVSDPKVDLTRVFRNSLRVLPYSIGYGLAAFTFVITHQDAHVEGFLAMLLPTILLQRYLLQSARESEAHEKERAAFTKEREELLRKEAEASERERTKIAGDLHDGVVQNLVGMGLMLSAEASQLKANPEALNGRHDLIELLEQSANDAREATKDLRTLIIDLAPPTLRREGLQAALLEVLRDIKRKGTDTTLDLPSNLRLRKDRAALIFRVANEVLRNVAAHAQAKNVKVELVTEDGSAILSIEDDGKGFTPEDVARRRSENHLGTSAIVDLAEEAGGTLTIDSEPGRGTLVVLTLPIG